MKLTILMTFATYSSLICRVKLILIMKICSASKQEDYVRE